MLRQAPGAPGGAGHNRIGPRLRENSHHGRDDSRVQQLLSELLNAHATPEEVCRSHPDLLPLIRARWRPICHVMVDLEALFPTQDDVDVPAQPSTVPVEPTSATPAIPGYQLLDKIGRGGPLHHGRRALIGACKLSGARSDRSMVRTMRKRAFPAIIFA
jgi:hypothetical protein